MSPYGNDELDCEAAIGVGVVRTLNRGTDERSRTQSKTMVDRSRHAKPTLQNEGFLVVKERFLSLGRPLKGGFALTQFI
ncbi:unnamed protein product [Nippostrongylus brasiliensis]|uniref:Transposase n=1 Tax=Nippostrongylus brasiliensis TaxID=27835 RepID=A0A0N4Y1P9_NIPBR|nr:unnamed protein product [Nippostrongylus brasiliensis]